MGNGRVHEQIELWARELLDLTRRNRSIYYRPLKRGTLELVNPAPPALFRRLVDDEGLSVFVPPKLNDDEQPRTLEELVAHAEHAQVVSNRLTRQDVAASLKSLHRQASADLMDRGVQTLYVCFGMLHWQELEKANADVRSPLVFVPVVLEREAASDRYTLRRGDDDVVLNPSLQVLMRDQFDIELAADLDDIGAIEDLETVFASVRRAVEDYPWEVVDAAILKRATFHKEAMYRDLLDHIDIIAAHDLVRALADPDPEDAVGSAGAEIPAEAEIDAVAPPETAHLILDADASQRCAIEAAKRGTSFVMEGPPGTGKSQTIANMIAELLADGRSVLFVSEKAAALEVVANRLGGRGLDAFLLELHSHKASRKNVVQQLSDALRRHPQADPKLTATDRTRAEKLRRQLSDYAMAVNEIRQPLGRSISWVAGRLAQLADVPKAPTPAEVGAGLSADEAVDYLDTFEALSRSWAPVEDAEFVWRGFAAPTLTATDEETLRRDLNDLDGAITELQELSGEVAYRLGQPALATPGEATQLLALLEHVQKHFDVPEAWWTDDLTPVLARLDALEALVDRREKAVAVLETRYGSAWDQLDRDAAAQLDEAEANLAGLTPSLPLPATLTPKLVRLAADSLGGLADALRSVEEDVGRIEHALAVPTRGRTIDEVLKLAEIAELADAPVRPDTRWTVPATQHRVQAVLDELEPLTGQYQLLDDRVSDTFSKAVYELNLDEIAARLSDVSGIGKLGGLYRQAKRDIAGVALSGKATTKVLAKVNNARDAQRVRQELDRAEASSRELLGSFYVQRDCDIDGARTALATLDRAREALGDDFDPSGITRTLAGQQPDDPRIAQVASRVKDELRPKLAQVRGLKGLAHGADELTVELLRDRCERAAKELGRVARLLEEALARRAKPAPLAEVRKELKVRESVGRRGAQLLADAGADHDLFGGAYAGHGTDFASLREGLEWARELQALAAEPVTADRGTSLRSSDEKAQLRDAEAETSRLTGRVLSRFDDEHRASHADKLQTTFDGVRDQVAELEARIDEPRVWSQHRALMAELRARGWGDTLDFCLRQTVSSRSLPDVLEQAMYAAWFDATVSADERTRELTGAERESIVDSFRQQDRLLVDDAAEHVVRRCNERRPTSTIGAAGVIEREAEKKRRHMPVRTLLGKTLDVATDLKPCFMMSPLSVSQFLPSDYRFDVVIFDEASQIRPSDAINCIYRGDQLVVAGDDKQLPPTSFFDGAGDDDDVFDEEEFDEFESVLGLAKGSTSLRTLPLRWHYRSQHESLITFSNYRFYEGNLVTYPSADEQRPDLGVELCVVPGVYRRGGRRDNPIEARAVADRVLHHARHHPELSLGVVAFSKAQAEAVDDQIDVLRREHPDLESYFETSRLDGFFVKNLENVQGDERDIIVFTIGYGPDEAGKFTMNFGPINRDGGWRRLNVAVTRAKRRVEVVSSFDAARLDTRGSTNVGLKALQAYVDYASRGLPALAIDLSQSEGDVESPLEQSVFDTLRGWGYEVVPQVGAAGYRIDLAIRDPEQPGRFLIGIEADGAAYHSSKVARDRDRLRQSVLEGLGWRLYRVWGPSWYRDRQVEEQRLRAAIERAALGEDDPRQPTAAQATIERASADVDRDGKDWSSVYEVAALTAETWGRPHDRRNHRTLVNDVREVVAVEAPVHLEVICRRVADHFGHSLTRRVRAAVHAVVQGQAGPRGWNVTRDGFVWADHEFAARMPGESAASQRPIQHIPPEEVEKAVYQLLRDARVCSRDELLVAVRDFFGFRRMGANIAEALDTALENLFSSGLVQLDAADRLRVGEPTTADVS